ncbi:MAG: type I restriction-modification system subunit M [Tildeniella torsiva UHER 1998/13D]|jgi:type I restriction enzyme M protein|nr:type I restriction-modification system subunit M [Tildeniella torsiva UHER 1998/13D]
MLTDSELRSKVDTIWDRLWSSGLSNPMDSIEQFSYLLFLKRLDDTETRREKQAIRRKQEFTPQIPAELRWAAWVNQPAAAALKHVKEKVFPWLREMGAAKSSFRQYMEGAEFKLNKAGTLIEVCNLIDQMKISEQNQDVQGDLYEYLLGKLSVAGRNGQFRTPRHIIRMMVEMVAPQPNDRIGDLAAGTCGFLVNAYQYILEHATSSDILYDGEGQKHLVGDRLTPEQEKFLQKGALTAYDNDSGMTMLRIGSMNLMLHGIQQPRFFYMDTLSKSFNDEKSLDVVLMNPPFKGKMDESDINPSLPTRVTKTELLFLHLILRVLDMGGRCAVIVPDGVLFGSSKAHQEIRKTLIEDNRLDGVVSMPSGVFKPYAGVSTAVLLFTRGGTTDLIWFYDMAYDGFSLDDKRHLTPEQNDIPDILQCWQHRVDAEFIAQRQARLETLNQQIAPLKAEKLLLQKEMNRLLFEAAIAPEDDDTAQQALETDQQKLATLEAQIAPLRAEIDQLTRQFWVTKAQVKANKYDLSASRYRQVEPDEQYYEAPQVTMDRLLKLEHVMAAEVAELEKLLGS